MKCLVRLFMRVMACSVIVLFATPHAFAQIGMLTFAYNAGSRTLTVNGTLNVDRIVISELPNGAVALNGTPILATRPSSIQVAAMAGDDYIEVNGSVPTQIRCGKGNDVVFGGMSGDVIFGDNDHDFISGRGGFDELYGGDGDDVLLGGHGNDFLSGDNGNDRLSGDKDYDRLFGGAGRDTFAVGEPWGKQIVSVDSFGIRYVNLYDQLIDIGKGDGPADQFLDPRWLRPSKWW